jgi:hypothetical protein
MELIRRILIKIEAVMKNLCSNGCSSDLYTCSKVASSDTHPDLTVFNNGGFSRVVMNIPSPSIDPRWGSVVVKGGIEKACRSAWAVNKGISALCNISLGNAVSKWNNRFLGW